MHGFVAGPLNAKNIVTTNATSNYSMKQVIETSSRWAQFFFLGINVPTIVESWKEGEHTLCEDYPCDTLQYRELVFCPCWEIKETQL